MFRDLVDENGNRFLSDGMTVRWCRTIDAVNYAQSVAVTAGNPGVVNVTKAKILAGVYGEFVGQGYPDGPPLATIASVQNQVAQTLLVSTETKGLVEDLQLGGGTVDVAAIAKAVNDDAAARLKE